MRLPSQSFLLGCTTAAVVCGVAFYAFVLPVARHDSFESGRRYGVVDAHRALMPKIQSLLGDDYRKADGYHPVFEVKTEAVVVVERNGVRTLRVYAERP